MVESKINELVAYAQKQSILKKDALIKLADENKQALPADLPKEIHIPDAEELKTISAWMTIYAKRFPSYSKRQIRKAAQDHFSIKVYRKPYKAK